MKTSKKSAALVEDFDNAARTWGWEQDQGWGARVGVAQDAYTKAKNALVRRIERLEGDNRKLKAKNADLKAELSNVVQHGDY